MMAATIDWLCEVFSERLAAVVANRGGQAPHLARRAAAAEPCSLCIEHRYSGVPGAAWVGAPDAGWLALGRWILSSAGIETAEPIDARNAAAEVFSQALAGMAPDLARRRGAEIAPAEMCETPPPDAAPGFDLDFAGPGLTGTLAARFAPELIAALEPGTTALAPPETVAPAPATDLSAGRTLDLLMDVELPVSVSFGRAQLPLRDVLKLTTGAIVELNRTISEPVEVIVNNAVIARGDVVVIDGNYGVRIQEIVSRETRMRSLK